jgi:uncharacterized protein YndB with AHSA1/START domain
MPEQQGHEFETDAEIDVDATPEQVWEAIATGPGVDSWFMGRNEVDPGPGGAVRTIFGAYAAESAVTGWDPPNRLAYGTRPAADGRFVAYEFLVEGRAASSTVVRLVTSGFLPGTDWEAEFEAMTLGNAMFFRTLAEYVTHFAGRTALPVTAFGPPVTDWPAAWAALHSALHPAQGRPDGHTGPPAVGDRVVITPPGLSPVDGVVYFTNPHTLGIRAGDALYRFLQGFHGSFVAAHHLFTPTADQASAERGWTSWLNQIA